MLENIVHLKFAKALSAPSGLPLKQVPNDTLNLEILFSDSARFKVQTTSKQSLEPSPFQQIRRKSQFVHDQDEKRQLSLEIAKKLHILLTISIQFWQWSAVL